LTWWTVREAVLSQISAYRGTLQPKVSHVQGSTLNLHTRLTLNRTFLTSTYYCLFVASLLLLACSKSHVRPAAAGPFDRLALWRSASRIAAYTSGDSSFIQESSVGPKLKLIRA